MMKLKYFYLLASIIGTVLSWIFFADFFNDNGFNIPFFIMSLFENGAAGGFSIDILISICVFWIWVFFDARQNNIKKWWLVLPAGCFVGLSLALPLYLYLKTTNDDL